MYAGDFYAGRPAVTVNRFGEGKAWYLAARTDERFLDDFYGAIAEELAIPRAIGPDLPQGVSTLLWNCCTDRGLKVPSGMYLIRVTARTADGQQSNALCPVPVRR